MRPQFDPVAYRPRLPREPQRFGIAFVGCGSVVRKWQLPHYRANGLRVVGCWDRDQVAVSNIVASNPGLRAYESLESLLADPGVAVVDIATSVTGRAELIRAAVLAGKHVLAQKPLCRNEEELNLIAESLAAAPGVRLALNFNGRWAPPWRVATSLIRDGAIGDVFAVTHLHDFRISWLPNLERHGSPLFLLFDYLSHWVDISLTWLTGRRSLRVWADSVTRHAGDSSGAISQVGWLNFTFDDGASVTIRTVAAAHRYSGHPFVVHGTAGTLRGAVDAPVGGDYVEIDSGAVIERPTLNGNWFPDGFVGSMGELLVAVEEGREPEHAFQSAAVSHRVTLAACRSAETVGRPVEVSLL